MQVEIETPAEVSEHSKEDEERAEDEDEESEDEEADEEEESDKKDVPSVMINIAEESDETSQSDSRSRSSSPKVCSLQSLGQLSLVTADHCVLIGSPWFESP